MPIDSVIIKLVRNGVDISPDYSITIRGYGTVTYEGNDNVGVNGRVEESIDNEKIVSLLSEFKNAGFFSFDDKYPVENPEGRPYATISLSLPDESKEVRSKSITFYHGDHNVPEALKKLGDKIDEMIGSDKWVKATTMPIEEPESFPKTPYLKKPTKPLILTKKTPVKIIVAIVIVAVVVVFLFVNPGGILSPADQILEYDPPQITFSTTINEASNYSIKSLFNSGMNPATTSTFEQGETAYVFYIFSNVTHNNNYSIVEDITVKYDGEEVLHYNEKFENSSDSTKFYDTYSFTTNESWNTGEYIVTIVLSDEVSGKSTISEFNFNLTEVYPKITTFTTASNIRAYRDYDISTIFEQNDTVFVYLEYSDITTTIDDATCNLYLKVNVTSGGVEYFSNSLNKTEVGNNSHAWWFITDINWPTTGFYTVDLYLLDKATGRSVSNQAYFFL